MRLTGDRPDDLAGKIVAALDRIAHARRTQRQVFATESGLTLLQVELLATLADGAPPQPLIGLLATELGVSQPTVTDSVRALERKDLVRRDPDPSDARRTLITLTPDGRRMVVELAARDRAFTRAVADLPTGTQEQTLGALLGVIGNLVGTGAITVARTCLTCRFHRREQGTDHCDLLQAELPAPDLRVNCPEHQRV